MCLAMVSPFDDPQLYARIGLFYLMGVLDRDLGVLVAMDHQGGDVTILDSFSRRDILRVHTEEDP